MQLGLAAVEVLGIEQAGNAVDLDRHRLQFFFQGQPSGGRGSVVEQAGGHQQVMHFKTALDLQGSGRRHKCHCARAARAVGVFPMIWVDVSLDQAHEAFDILVQKLTVGTEQDLPLDVGPGSLQFVNGRFHQSISANQVRHRVVSDDQLLVGLGGRRDVQHTVFDVVAKPGRTFTQDHVQDAADLHRLLEVLADRVVEEYGFVGKVRP